MRGELRYMNKESSGFQLCVQWHRSTWYMHLETIRVVNGIHGAVCWDEAHVLVDTLTQEPYKERSGSYIESGAD